MATDSQLHDLDFDAAENRTLSFGSFIKLCLAKWKWFVASAFLFVCLGVLYCLLQQPVYERTMQVLIKDQDAGGSTADLAGAFSSMGLLAPKTSVYNELIALRSPAIMSEVVKRLDLENNYSMKGTFHWKTLYGKNLPFTVQFAGKQIEKGGSFEAELTPGGELTLDHFITYDDKGKPVKHSQTIKARIGQTITKSPIGEFNIIPNPLYTGVRDDDWRMKVSHSSMTGAIEDYSAKLKVDLTDSDAEVIDLSIKDVSVARAEDVLNTIITVYNENWIEDKNRTAIATSQFISQRLGLIEKELGDVDTDISNYKSDHLLTNLEESSSIYMNQAAKASEEMLEVTNQLSMARYMKEYLADPKHANDVIPVNTGIGNPVLEQQIPVYNSMLLQRNILISNSSAQNPVVREMDNQLEGQRAAIANAVNGQIAGLTRTLQNMESHQGKSESHLAQTPGQALYLLSIERQQKVKEALYIYLLQKREENELTQTFTAYNTRIITPPYGPANPVSPKRNLIVLVALFFGLAIPGTIVYAAESSNTRIRSRKDLENLAVPFAGEIPFFGKQKKVRRLLWSKKRRQQETDTPLKVVSQGNRDVTNEAFRVIRSNLEMMMGRGNSNRVLMLTSMNAGSGKSFVAYNLGAAFALKGHRTLLVDGDLRHGSLSMFADSPHKGLTDYLNGKQPDWSRLVVQDPEHPDLSILPIGNRPPNPAELLDSDRFAALVREAREEFDFVIIDCPPVDIVVDTQIIAPHADRTLFVVRAGLFEKDGVVELDDLYHSKRFNHLSVILNGTSGANSRYQTYGSAYYGEV